MPLVDTVIYIILKVVVAVPVSLQMMVLVGMEVVSNLNYIARGEELDM
jgi:hypothetical protein